MAQGTGNLIAPFFGGIAATGALARTATNVRSGARSPLAAIFHALFVLLAVLALAPVLGYLPMASLAALLLVVAWNMSEIKHFVHALRVAPKSDVLVLLTCFAPDRRLRHGGVGDRRGDAGGAPLHAADGGGLGRPAG